MRHLKVSKFLACTAVAFAAITPSIAIAKYSGYNPGYYHSDDYYRSHPNSNDMSYNQQNKYSQNEGQQYSSEISYHGHEQGGGEQRSGQQNSYSHEYNSQRHNQQNNYSQDYYRKNNNPYGQQYGGYGNYGGYQGGGGGGVVYPYPDPESQPGMSDDSNALYESYLRSGPRY